MEKLRLYTIRDLKDWLFNDKPKEGLSEAIITTTRAYSFIHNPYVTDDMPVVSALFVGEELADGIVYFLLCFSTLCVFFRGLVEHLQHLLLGHHGVTQIVAEDGVVAVFSLGHFLHLAFAAFQQSDINGQ